MAPKLSVSAAVQPRLVIVIQSISLSLGSNAPRASDPWRYIPASKPGKASWSRATYSSSTCRTGCGISADMQPLLQVYPDSPALPPSIGRHLRHTDETWLIVRSEHDKC